MQLGDHLLGDGGGVEMGCAVMVEIECGLCFLNRKRGTSERRGWTSYTLRSRLLKGLSALKSH